MQLTPVTLGLMARQHSAVKVSATQAVRFGADNSVQLRYADALKRYSFSTFGVEAKKGLANQNKVFSPTSINLAMSMAMNGAQDTTLDEIQSALAFDGMDVAAVNQGAKAYMNRLQSMDPSIKLNIANSLWVDKRFTLVPQFVADLQQEYGAEVANLDFTKADDAVKTMNTWISGKTNGLIPKMLQQIDPKTIAAIVNTTYLNAKWQKPFNAVDNHTVKFTTTAGKKVDVNMMTQVDNFKYRQFDGFEAIKLPYGNKKMSMVVLLPNKGTSLECLAGTLTAANWEHWSQALDRTNMSYGRISLPKHEVEFDLDAKGLLEQQGVKDAFNSKKADFSRMFGFKKPHISEVKHKAVIKVHEEGTEAAAATYVGFALEAMVETRQENFHMNVDRGFVTIIQDEESHTPLFMTTVDNPSFIESKKDESDDRVFEDPDALDLGMPSWNPPSDDDDLILE